MAAVQQTHSTIMAEITLANTPSEGSEEVFLPPDTANSDTLEQPGSLSGSEGKYYMFMPQEFSFLSQKISDCFSATYPPNDQKNTDAKSSSKEKTEYAQTKEFRVQTAEKSAIESQNETPANEQPTFSKADQTARKTLEPPPKQMSKTTSSPNVSIAHTKMDSSKAPSTSKSAEQAKGTKETKPQNKLDKQELSERQQIDTHTAREQTKAEERQEQKNRYDDQEEGFAEGEQRQKKEEHPDEKETSTVGKTKKVGLDPKEFFTYATEDSTLLSELFDMRVNHFDVLVLFIEIMKLSLKEREQARIARAQERELQLQHIQNMVDNFKQQGKWMLFSHLGSGVLGIVSGASPILGHVKGEWILDKAKMLFSSLNGMDKDQFFKSVSKITFSMSEMYKSSGQIQNTFSESSRTFDQHMADIRRTDWEEETRTMDEIKDHWKNIENFLHQSLQMYHEVIRQLYN